MLGTIYRRRDKLSVARRGSIRRQKRRQSAPIDFTDNTANSNGAAGIHVADSFSIEVCDNTADDNSHGILVTGTTDSDISMNSAHGNAVLDIAWDGYGDNSFSDNSADTTNV